MYEQNLKARIRNKRKVGKYIKYHTYSNVLNREFKAIEPDKKYANYVTQLRTINNKKHYLYPIIDLYNNEIKAFTVHDSNSNYLVDNVDLTGVEVMHSAKAHSLHHICTAKSCRNMIILKSQCHTLANVAITYNWKVFLDTSR